MLYSVLLCYTFLKQDSLFFFYFKSCSRSIPSFFFHVIDFNSINLYYIQLKEGRIYYSQRVHVQVTTFSFFIECRKFLLFQTLKLFIKHIQLKRLERRIIIFSLNISKNLLQLSEISCTHLTVIYFPYISNKLSSIIILFIILIHSLFIQCTKCNFIFLLTIPQFYLYLLT